MKLWARPGFEWAGESLVGLWCPVLTGNTGSTLLDCNLSTSNHGALTGYADFNSGWTGTQFGTAVNFNGVNNYVAIPDAINLRPTGSFTALVWFTRRADGQLFAIYSQTPNVAGIVLAFNVDGSSPSRIGSLIGRNTGTTKGTDWQTVAGATTVASETLNLAVVVFNRSSLAVFLNGTQDGSIAWTNPAGFAATSYPRLGVNQFSSVGLNSYFNGLIAECVFWHRAMSLNEIQILFQVGPGGAWQLQPPIRRYSALLAQAYAIAADTGSFALAGIPANLLTGRSITADQAQYVLSGQATGLQASRLLEADRGNLALTGLDAATLLGRLLDAGASAYSLNGSATDLLSARRITADQAVLLATGQDAGLSASRKLGASTGQFILVASDVNFTTSSGGAAPYYYLFLLGGAR